MRRLGRSLRELGMTEPMGLKSLGVILRETIRRNRVKNGIVYLQVTRGVARRDFAFPATRRCADRCLLRALTVAQQG